MIEATEMLARMGKKKFIEMASHPKGETVAQREHRTRWGKGTKLFQICEHHKVTIRGGKLTHECKVCERNYRVTKSIDFQPHFNMGLGCYVESKSEMKRIAKERGMIAIGDDRL